MIRCKKCGHTASRFKAVCPVCNEKHKLTGMEIEELLGEARSSMKKREFEYSLGLYKTLADMGIAQAEREYASILERGGVLPKNPDLAMRYFGSAAKKRDPYSAYRYSRLAARSSDRASAFWLAYAAVLGCLEAYLPAAEFYSDLGDEETAGYYYSLAAHGDDTDAIVIMAKRYYSGQGAEKNESYAKWYMDKLTLPPIHALRLAYKLRSAKAQIPPEPHFTSRSRILRGLIRDAARYSLPEVQLHLGELLSSDGTADALYTLGCMYIENVGCEGRTKDGIRLLESASELGSAEAAKYLGNIYAGGKIVVRDIDRALSYYKTSGGLGEGGAYEIMGDMFAEGIMVDQNPAYAHELYELGAKEGHEGCKTKAATIRQRREELFKASRAEIKDNPEKAAALCAESCFMGYLPAHRELARMFEVGIGLKKNRKMAFTWYSMAVEKGDTDAWVDLGRCYAYGIGTTFDFDRAINALNMARRYGSAEGERELFRLLNNKKRSMTRSLLSMGVRLVYQKKFAQATEILTTAAELECREAYYVLGCLCEFGLGVPTSRQRAFEHYNKAFDMGFRDPKQAYKLKILKMGR